MGQIFFCGRRVTSFGHGRTHTWNGDRECSLVRKLLASVRTHSVRSTKCAFSAGLATKCKYIRVQCSGLNFCLGIDSSSSLSSPHIQARTLLLGLGPGTCCPDSDPWKKTQMDEGGNPKEFSLMTRDMGSTLWMEGGRTSSLRHQMGSASLAGKRDDLRRGCSSE